MALELGGFSLMMLSAWLLNEGLRAQEMFNARTIAKPPSIPRKMFAAVSIGLGVAAASFAGGLETGLIGSVAMGAMASAAQIVAFGLDPMRGKGIGMRRHGSNTKTFSVILKQASPNIGSNCF